MIEFAATFVFVGGAIAASVAAGTRYLNSHAQHSNLSSAQAKNEPLVRPSHPSGGDWPEVRS